MSLFDEIQNDILNDVDLSAILRKAKVLAFKLKNKEFKDWIENELNGYDDDDLLPKYRKLETIAQGDFSNGYWQKNFQLIPVMVIPGKYRYFFNETIVNQGVKGVESLIDTAAKDEQGNLAFSIPPELYGYLNGKVFTNLQCHRAWRVINKSQLIQILDTTRNSLLNFILELSEKYPEVKSDSFSGKDISNEEIRHVFNYYILGGKHQIVNSANSTMQGDNMAIFDQRNQKVNTQYNSAGDINFNTVQDSSEFIAELQKLKAEFLKVAEQEAIDGEIVTDAEYQLTKAIQQSQKPEPDKKTIVEHLKTTTELVEGVITTTGLITAITKAAEVAQTIFN